MLVRANPIARRWIFLFHAASTAAGVAAGVAAAEAPVEAAPPGEVPPPDKKLFAKSSWSAIRHFLFDC